MLQWVIAQAEIGPSRNPPLQVSQFINNTKRFLRIFKVTPNKSDSTQFLPPSSYWAKQMLYFSNLRLLCYAVKGRQNDFRLQIVIPGKDFLIWVHFYLYWLYLISSFFISIHRLSMLLYFYKHFSHETHCLVPPQTHLIRGKFYYYSRLVMLQSLNPSKP